MTDQTKETITEADLTDLEALLLEEMKIAPHAVLVYSKELPDLEGCWFDISPFEGVDVSVHLFRTVQEMFSGMDQMKFNSGFWYTYLNENHKANQ